MVLTKGHCHEVGQDGRFGGLDCIRRATDSEGERI
jgi:hypothetical protein